MKRALAALGAAQIAYGLGSRPPAATRALVGAMLATSALEARRAGDGRAIGAAGAVGFAAELVGVATGRPFGHYAYSSQLGPPGARRAGAGRGGVGDDGPAGLGRRRAADVAGACGA